MREKTKAQEISLLVKSFVAAAEAVKMLLEGREREG